MAYNGYPVFDSDLHVIEPADLWARYIDPKYRDRGPVGLKDEPFSTDCPHSDSAYPKATDTFMELPLDDTQRRAILWANCVRMYGFTPGTVNARIA